MFSLEKLNFEKESVQLRADFVLKSNSVDINRQINKTRGP